MNLETDSRLLRDQDVHRLVPGSSPELAPDSIRGQALTAAAKQTSIEQVCQTSEAAPCGNTVRGVLEEQLDLEGVETKANQRLDRHLQV